MKSMRVAACLLVLCSFSALAQTAARPRARKTEATPVRASAATLAAITIKGNSNFTAEQVIRESGLRIGQAAGVKEFDAAQGRLLDAGVFSSVSYRYDPAPDQPGKVAATINVVEVPQMYGFRTEELGVNDAELTKWMSQRDTLFGTKIPATDKVLDRFSKEVTQYLAAKGKNEEVAGRVTSENGTLVVVFRPSRLPSVAEIYFKDNHAVDNVTLQKAAANSGIGAVYTERRFREVLDASVRREYEAKGYMAAKFTKLETAPAKGNKGVAVTVTVEEGPVYKLEDVQVSGVENGKLLLRKAAIKLGETIDMNAVNAGIDEMLRTMRRDGYIKVVEETQRQLNHEKKTAIIQVHMTPGPQYSMGALTLEGLDISTEPHIRKLWSLKKGKPFDNEYPDYFLRRLREDQVFDNPGDMKSYVTVDDKELRADVKLWFGRGGDLPTIGPEDERERRKRQQRQQQGQP